MDFRYNLFLIAFLVPSVCGCDTLGARDPGIEVLEELRENLLQAESFSISMGGIKGNLRETVHLSVSKPNLLRAEFLMTLNSPGFEDRDGVHRVIISDGERLFLIKNPNRNGYYQEFKAPKDFWQIFDPEVWTRAPDLHHMVANNFPALCLLHPQDPGDFFEGAGHNSTKTGSDQIRHSFVISSNMELLDGREVPGIVPPVRPAELIISLIEGEKLGGARFALLIDESEVWAYDVLEWYLPAVFPADTFKFENRSELKQVNSLLEGE